MINRKQAVVAVVLAAVAVGAAVVTARSLGIVGQTVYPAVVQPRAQLALNFANSGAVVEIDVHPGDRVKAGQVLGKQDQLPLLEELAATRSDLSAATAEQQALQSGSPQSLVQFVTLQMQNAQQMLADAVRSASDLRSQATLVVEVAQLEVQAANQNIASDGASYQSRCGESSATSTYCLSLQREVRIDTQQADIANAGLDRAVKQSATMNDQAQQDIDAKRVAVASAQAQQSSPGTVITPTVAQADVQVQLARAQADQARAQQELSATTLTSPISGIVTAVNGAVGQVAGSQGVSQYAGQQTAGNQAGSLQILAPSGGNSSTGPLIAPLVQVIDDRTWEAVAQVSEGDIHSLHVGARATVTFGALSGKQMNGVVQSIVFVADRGGSSVVYPVIFSLAGDPSGLEPGMSASVAPTSS